MLMEPQLCRMPVPMVCLNTREAMLQALPGITV